MVVNFLLGGFSMGRIYHEKGIFWWLGEVELSRGNFAPGDLPEFLYEFLYEFLFISITLSLQT